MWFRRRGRVIERQGEREFPDFYSFFGGYFHQDSIIFGNTLEEIVGAFKADVASEPEMVKRVKNDIEHFLADRPDDKRLNEDLEGYFMPGVLPTGWEPGITNWRQWLTRVAELLGEAPQASNG